MSKDGFSGRISGLRRGKWDVKSCLENTCEEKAGENVRLNKHCNLEGSYWQSDRAKELKKCSE